MTDTNKFKFRPVLDTRYNVQETKDGDIAVYFKKEEVIEMYDESDAIEEITWGDDNPENEHCELVKNKVKIETVVMALDQFFDRDFITYLSKYAEEHEDEILERQNRANQEDDDRAFDSYMNCTYEDY